MQSRPAIFAGTVFSLFGAASPGWTAMRVRYREPVVPDAGRSVPAAAAPRFALTVPIPGVRCFTRCRTRV